MLLQVPSSSSSCNAATADHIQALNKQLQFQLLGSPSPSLSIRRRNAVVSCASAPERSPVLAVETGELNGRDLGFEESLAGRLRLGSLTEDGLSYKEKFIVRCYEVGINKTATVETIANLLQVISLSHFICKLLD